MSQIDGVWVMSLPIVYETWSKVIIIHGLQYTFIIHHGLSFIFMVGKILPKTPNQIVWVHHTYTHSKNIHICIVLNWSHLLGTATHEKLHSILLNQWIVNDIRKISPNAQTSCLEGIHATLNIWHPKMISFSWMGTICR